MMKEKSLYIVGLSNYSVVFVTEENLYTCIGVCGGGGGGGRGGQLPSQIRAKQWGQFGQSKKKKSARES